MRLAVPPGGMKKVVLSRLLSYVLVLMITPVALCAETPAAMANTKTPILPLSEVKAGMHGIAYTVFEGVTPEPMDVEILGVLRNANGPKGDIILVRLQGKRVEYTGVVAGMSGSPVYVDGKLMGAIVSIGEPKCIAQSLIGHHGSYDLADFPDGNTVHRFDHAKDCSAAEIKVVDSG